MSWRYVRERPRVTNTIPARRHTIKKIHIHFRD